MASLSEMGDLDFLGYCAIHCQTPRALFSSRDCHRLAMLAGVEIETYGMFVEMHEDVAGPWIEEASKRLAVPTNKPSHLRLVVNNQHKLDL